MRVVCGWFSGQKGLDRLVAFLEDDGIFCWDFGRVAWVQMLDCRVLEVRN